MANNGSIDEIIGQKGFDDVTLLTEKMNTLYVSFKQNVTAINLMNDALGKASSIKDVSANIDAINTKTKKATQVQTEFVETVYKLDKAVSDTGHALSDTEVAYAKLTATMANGNKAAKLVTEETKKQSTATKELEGNYKALLAQQKAALAQAREVGVVYGTSSQKFKDAAQSANAYSVQVNSMNKQLGIHNSEVGNYAENIKKGTSGIVSGLNSIWGGVRKLAYILPGVGIAGIFTMAFEAITPLIEKMDLFNNKAKDMREVMASGLATTTEEVNTLKRLYEITQNHTLAIEKRKNAVDKLQELYPAYFKNIKDETFLNGGAQKSYDDLRESIIETAKAKAVESKIAEIINKDLEKELELTENVRKAKANQFNDKGKTVTDPLGNVRNLSLIRDQEVKFAQSQLDSFKIEQNEKLKIYKDYLDKKQGLETLSKVEAIAKEKSSKSDKKSTSIINPDFTAGELQDINNSFKKQLEGQIKVLEEWRNNPEVTDALKLELDVVIDKGRLTLAAQEAAELNAQLMARGEEKEKAKKDQKEELEYYNKKLEAVQKINQMVQDSAQVVADISEIFFMREMEQIDAKDKALKNHYDKELRFIEQSGLSDKQKAKAKAKLDAENEAQQKKIDRDRITALRKQATLQKALDIVSIIGNTAVAITKAFAEQNYVGAILAGVVGAAQLAKVIATPLPQYAKGRGKGKAETAIVGEAGQEAIIRENGKVELTPNKATITYLNPNDQVISHHDLIKNASYVHLMKQGNVSTSTNDKFQSAEIVEEIKDLKKVLINKNLSVNTTNYSGFDSYLKANIR